MPGSRRAPSFWVLKLSRWKKDSRWSSAGAVFNQVEKGKPIRKRSKSPCTCEETNTLGHRDGPAKGLSVTKLFRQHLCIKRREVLWITPVIQLRTTTLSLSLQAVLNSSISQVTFFFLPWLLEQRENRGTMTSWWWNGATLTLAHSSVRVVSS